MHTARKICLVTLVGAGLARDCRNRPRCIQKSIDITLTIAIAGKARSYNRITGSNLS
jgi:hypothetical protein